MLTFSNAKSDTKESPNIYRTVLKPSVSIKILLYSQGNLPSVHISKETA